MLNFEQAVTFVLVFTRISSFLAVAPVFGGTNSPRLAKAGLSFVLAALLLPMVSPAGASVAGGLPGLAVAVIQEIFIGMLMGLVCSFILHSLTVAGQVLDIQIGFAMSGFFDPLSGGQATLLAKFLYLLGLTLFLTLDGHHMLISGLFRSFSMVPLSGVEFGGGTVLVLIQIFARMVTIAVQIAAPVIAVVLIVDVCLGLVGKTAPQMNIFMLGFPIKIGVGILTLAVMVPLLGTVFRSLFRMMEKDLYTLLKGLS